MKKSIFTIALLAACMPAAMAQLTQEQKLADFRFLAGLYNKYYALYEWKRDVFQFDLLNVKPWLERVAQTKDDLDFYELCVEYVASLHDSHDAYSLPSTLSATLGFTVDIYDGKVLVDSVTRSRLPQSRFPFEAGDELVSVDGKEVGTLLDEFTKYTAQSNPRSTRRVAAARMVTRSQSRMPHASELGDSAQVVIRRQNGALETYTVPWFKSGVPVEAGPVLSPKLKAARRNDQEPAPDYMRPLLQLQHSAVSGVEAVLGSGSRTPLFGMPAGFVQRAGKVPADFFYSGSFDAGGYKIGYIRIPNYSPASSTQALRQFDAEIAWFQQNSDGLIVDQMRNPGGDLCFGQEIAARLIPYPFRATGIQIRAFWGLVDSFYYNLSAARAWEAEQWVIDLYEVIYKELHQAYTENRGVTGPLPVCANTLDTMPATGRGGSVIAYTKPVMMLMDEFSSSAADSVPAMFQDAGRGVLFGMRTNGAGGINMSLDAGAYSEGWIGMTVGAQTRRAPVSTPEYPASDLIENVGVRPDIEADYMTKENLLGRGKPFVDAFTAAMVEQIKSKR